VSDLDCELDVTEGFTNDNQARVDALFDVNRYQEAEKLIREQLSIEPEDAYWLYYLARVQLVQDKPKDAENSLFNSLRCDPSYSWGYFLLSCVSHELRNFVQELKCAKKCVELDPEEPAFLQRLAEAHIQNGEVKHSRLVLQQLLKIDPDSETTFQMLGDIEFELGNFLAAEEAYRGALKFDPENIEILNDLARCLMSQKKKLREAIDVLYNLVQLVPANKTISKNLYLAIRDWVDKNSFKGKGKKSFVELPESLQYFYNDYKGRTSIFEAWGNFTWVFVWIAALAVMTFFFEQIR